jgi:histidinol-phosphate/aromatic aminotransferase/cobyric acid decarboxylase-like protein
MKKDLSIWNINSFGEFYLQIAEKYKKDYVKALVEFRKERTRYVSELEKISNLRVLPSQANYVMVEIINGITAKQLTKELLVKYNLFIKDLTAKLGGNKQYIRLAIRNTQDNDKLVSAIKEIFEKNI